MKKLIQLALVVVLVVVLFQAVAGVSVVSSSSLGSNAASSISSPVDASAQGVQMATCLVRVKGVICVRPNVGWNS